MECYENNYRGVRHARDILGVLFALCGYARKLCSCLLSLLTNNDMLIVREYIVDLNSEHRTGGCVLRLRTCLRHIYCNAVVTSIKVDDSPGPLIVSS